MQVKLDVNASARIGEAEVRPSRRPRAGQSQEDELVLSESQSLLRAAQDDPVRPEKVAQAQAALAGSKYPPTEVIDQISRLLAIETTATAQ